MGATAPCLLVWDWERKNGADGDGGRGKGRGKKGGMGEAIYDIEGFQQPSYLNMQKQTCSYFINSTTHKSPQLKSSFHCGCLGFVVQLVFIVLFCFVFNIYVQMSIYI